MTLICLSDDGRRFSTAAIKLLPSTSCLGDFLTLFGAYWTARAVILTKQQADAISSVPYGGPHPLHAAALLAQSRAARAGLVCVAVGAGFQIVSKLIEEFFS